MSLEEIGHLDFELSLKDRAEAEYEKRKRKGEAELLIMAQDLIYDILDVTNAENPRINIGEKNVVFEIEGMRFMARRMAAGNEGMTPRLFVWKSDTQDWKIIKELSDLGELLALYPCIGGTQ